MEKLDDIQGELEAARQRLKGVEDNIKKSIGRDVIGPANQRAGFKRTSRVVEDEETPRRLVTAKRRNVVIRRDFAPQPAGERVSAKKRLGEQTLTVFSRLSGPPRGEDDDDGEKSAKVPSQVIVTDTPSRRDVLEAQSGDQHSKARNRRMFGALLGTLQKFRQEEDALKEKVEKRAQVEKKLEEAALREREEIKKKRQELFSSRRQQQIEIRQLEFKLTRLKQLELWEKNKKHLLNFIQTTATPRIFYLPKKHNEKTEKLLETTQEEVNKTIEEKRAKVEKTIADFFERRPTVGNREKKVVEKEDGEEEEEEEVVEEVEEEEKEENGSVSDKENNASPPPLEADDTLENL